MRVRMWSLDWIVFSGLAAIATVTQASLNARFARSMGLWEALLLNNAVVLVFSIVGCLLWSGARKVEIFSVYSEHFRSHHAWALLPGLCGALIVFAIPRALSNSSGINVFVALMVVQLIFAAAWDVVAHGTPMSGYKWAAVLFSLLALGSLMLGSRSSQA